MNTERADYLQHLMGHSRCAERYRIGLVKFGKDKMLPGVVARASIQSEVGSKYMLFVASFMELVRVTLARSLFPIWFCVYFYGISSDLADEAYTGCRVGQRTVSRRWLAWWYGGGAVFISVHNEIENCHP